jgi:hypothetical protein
VSPLTTVAQLVAFVLIVDKSDIVSCFPQRAVAKLVLSVGCHVILAKLTLLP